MNSALSSSPHWVNLETTQLVDYFLIAPPTLSDNTFSGAVIYVLEHNADGATGIIINRPTDVTFHDLINRLHLKLETDSPKLNQTPIFWGGPVQGERGIVLHTLDAIASPTSRAEAKSTAPIDQSEVAEKFEESEESLDTKESAEAKETVTAKDSDNTKASKPSLPPKTAPLNDPDARVMQHYLAQQKLTPSLGLTSSFDILEAIVQGKGPSKFLLALGYAGWGAGQLEKEIANSDWLVVKADHRLLFETIVPMRYAQALRLLNINMFQLSDDVGNA